MSKRRADKRQSRGRCRLSNRTIDGLSDQCERWALELNAQQDPYINYDAQDQNSSSFTVALAGMGTLAIGVLINLPALMW